ncbi:MAG: sensor domain-containing diguanylate cyclase [Saccharospirillum sp.]|nr:sensor domain-containing diguanylate cyclase [Saccharospirillum sp.]
MLKPSRNWAGLALVFLCATISHAQVSIVGGNQSYELLPHLEILEDVERQWSLADVQSLPASQWQTASTAAPNFSFSDSAWWLRLPLHNPTESSRSLVFDIAQPLLDYASATWLVEGEVRTSWQTGSRYSANTRPVPYRGFAFPLELPPGAQGELLIRFDTFDGLYDALPMALFSHGAFFEAKWWENLAFGVYYGIIIGLLLYNFVVWIQARERNFLLYSAYLACFLVWNLAFRGYLALGPLANFPLLYNQAVGFFASGIFMFLILFTSSFLGLRDHMPRMSLVLRVVMYSLSIPVVLTLAGFYSIVYQILIPQALLVMTLVLVAAVHQSLQGQRSARIFLLAWGFLIASAFIYYARVYGLIESSWFTENALNIGSAIEVFVIGLALADRINQLKQQQTRDQLTILEQERAYSERLQQQVDEQTKALRRLNRQLQHDSQTDSLTGLRNRRNFYYSLGEAIKRSQRHQEPLALALIDIDYFKQINDHWGHPYGDEVLKQFAEVMNQAWKRSTDGVFRLGGEEFGVIFEVKSRDDLPCLLDRFRAALASKQINYPDQNNGYLTASIGMVVIEPAEMVSPETAYSRADAALYASKKEGRDRIYYTRPELGPEEDLAALYG